MKSRNADNSSLIRFLKDETGLSENIIKDNLEIMPYEWAQDLEKAWGKDYPHNRMALNIFEEFRSFLSIISKQWGD